MSEKREVTFVESAQLFNEMVLDKYFSDPNTENMMIMIAGNADQSLLHGVVCGKPEYLAQALYGTCEEDERIKAVVMKVAGRIAIENMRKKLQDMNGDIFGFNPDDINNCCDD